MYSEKLRFDECELTHILKIIDKETQTSDIFTDDFINTPELQPPRDIAKSDKGSVTVFEYNKIEDFESPISSAVLRKILKKDVLNDSEESFEGISNEYQYCKEVIHSVLKNCRNSEEGVYTTDQVYPDYQHCFQIYEETKEVERNNSSDNCVSKINIITSNSSKKLDNIMETKNCLPDSSDNKEKDTISSHRDPVCRTETPKPKCKPKTPEPKKPKCVKKSKEPTCPLKEEKSEPKPDCPVQKPLEVEENTLKCPVCGLSRFDDPCHDNKLSYEVESSTQIQKKDENKEKAVEPHRETLTTIKTAMEGFINKVYKKTQDAVTVIKTESVRQIDTYRKSKSENIQSKATCDSKSAQSITAFSFLRRVDSKDKIVDSVDTDNQQSTGPSEIIEKIVSKVDSVISLISENVPDMLKPKLTERSSPYDVPTPPKKISHDMINNPVPNSNSVFTVIKNRIYSMFCDDKDDISKCSSSSSQPNKEDSDEDLINKLIE